MELVCTICADLFDLKRDVSAVHCGHIFHRKCLDEWTNVQKSCPQCRQAITGRSVIKKIYFDTCDDPKECKADLSNKVNELEVKLMVKQKNLAEAETEKEKLKEDFCLSTLELERVRETLRNKEAEVSVLQKEVQYAVNLFVEVEYLRTKNKSLTKQVEEYQNVKDLVDGTEKEAAEILAKFSHLKSNQELLMYFTVLKSQLSKSIDTKKRMSNDLDKCQRQIINLREELQTHKRVEMELKSDLKHSEETEEVLRRKICKLQCVKLTAENGAASGIGQLNGDVEGSVQVLDDSDRCSPSKVSDSPEINTPAMPPKPSSRLKAPSKRLLVSTSYKTNTHPVRQNATLFSTKDGVRAKRPTLSTASSSTASSSTTASFNASKTNNRGTSYNGFGGHSKPDIYPTGNSSSSKTLAPSPAAGVKPKLFNPTKRIPLKACTANVLPKRFPCSQPSLLKTPANVSRPPCFLPPQAPRRSHATKGGLSSNVSASIVEIDSD